MLAGSGRADGDASGTGPGLRFHNDLNVLTESDQKAHQSLDGKAFQLVMQQSGDLGLIDFERSRNFRLGKSASFHNPIDRSAEASFGVELSRIGQPHIRK